MADTKDLEKAFRDAPKGSQEANKAFKAWKEAANAPQPVAAKKAARKSRSK